MVFAVEFDRNVPRDLVPHVYTYMTEENYRHPSIKGIINFYYKIEDILEDVFMISSYVGKTVRTEKGETKIEDIAMTVDDERIFRNFLEEGMAELYERICAHTKYMNGGYRFDEVYEFEEVDEADVVAGNDYIVEKQGTMIGLNTAGGAVRYFYATKDFAQLSYDNIQEMLVLNDFVEIPDAQNSVHYMIWWKDWYNENANGMLDNAIKSGLCNYVLSKHMAIVYPDKAQYYAQLFDDNVKSVTQRINTQKHDIRRPYIYY